MDYDLALRIARAGTPRCQFLVEGLDLEAATNIPGAEWEPFQLAHLNDDSNFRLERKSRQVGWSWLIAAEALALMHLNQNQTVLFLSINREEASEKIRYLRDCYEALYPAWRKRLVQDAQTMMVWEDGCRAVSLPQRPSRGKPRSWIYLDEYAHYRLDREIYTAGVPVTTKGGKVRIGSTTLGARGMFWEIDEQKIRSYPGYSRSATPWWEVSAIVADEWRGQLREVSRAAPLLTTAERVERFGSDRLKAIYANMPEDDFKQEYECEYVDETVAYIPWADITASTMPETVRYKRWLTRTEGDAHDAIDDLALAVYEGEIRGPLVWGLDVGRKRDLTELTVIEILPGDTHMVRAVLSLDRQNFEVQYQLCKALLDRVPAILRGYMDRNGLGMQLAETLHARDGYDERAMPMDFTSLTKAQMAQHMKTRFQRRNTHNILIPDARDLKYQVHSIRRRVTQYGNVVFDVEESERHHADKFWSLALANEAAEVLGRVGTDHSPTSVTMLMTRKLDALDPEARLPELSDDTHGFTRDEMDALVAGGLTQFINSRIFAMPGSGVLVPSNVTPDSDTASPSPSPSESSSGIGGGEHDDFLADLADLVRRLGPNPRERSTTTDTDPERK